MQFTHGVAIPRNGGRGVRRSIPSAVCFLCLLIASTPDGRANESTDAGDNTGSAVQFGATPVFAFSPIDFCERDYDLVSCTTGMFTLGFQADALYRFPFPWFSLGLVGGVQFEFSQVESCSSDGGCVDTSNARLWRVAVEARFTPLIRRRVMLWLAMEGGVVGSSGRAFSAVGGETGGGIGFDLSIGRHLLIGSDLRALFYGLGRADDIVPDGGKVQVSNSLWISLGLLKLSGRFSL